MSQRGKLYVLFSERSHRQLRGTLLRKEETKNQYKTLRKPGISEYDAYIVTNTRRRIKFIKVFLL